MDSKAKRCANCEQPLAGRYCSACGQEDKDPARIPLKQIFRDWLADAFTFDSRLFRTLKPLIAKPGFLTVEYLEGRRVPYVPPLRLFVFLSFLMFLSLAFLGVELAWVNEDSTETVVAIDPSAAVADSPPSDRPVTEPEPVPAPDAPVSPPPPRSSHILDNPEEFSRRVMDLAPQTLLVLAPFFAGLLWLMHGRRERFFVPHLIFSLHLHAFVFLVVAVGCLVDLPFPERQRPGNLLVLLTAPPYLFLAQRRVYGGGLWLNAFRTAALIVVHAVAWVLLMVLIVALVIAMSFRG